MTPTAVVIHYTVSGTASSAVAWFKNPMAKASAHLIVGRDGEVIQCVRFRHPAWHAGASEWRGRKGCNQFTIGIEVVNWGPLVEVVDMNGRVRYAPSESDRTTVPLDDVVHARHETDKSCAFAHWQRYPDKQVAAVFGAVKAICARYGVRDVIGHSDIAPGRKVDPGPAWPMAALREFVFHN